MEAKVSIIIPVYNSEKFIEKCLQSIITQTYKNIEILVINDGSSDKSHDIITEFEQIDKRIIYLQQENAGVAVARNNALTIASGKYLLFVDSDDYIGKDYVKNLVTCAEHNNSELVICGYTLVYLKNNRQKSVIPGKYERGAKEEWAYRISAVCSRLYSHRFWKEHGLKFIEEENARGEDVPIAIYSNVMAKNIQVIKCADYFYVQHEESAMNNRKRKVKFRFPYKSFETMYCSVRDNEKENSYAFFWFGILKFLAQFKFVLYRSAVIQEKKNFDLYVVRLLKDDYERIVNEWKRIIFIIDLPFVYKIVISLFVLIFYSKMK